MRNVILLLFIVLCISSCKKDADILSNNNAPYYGEIPTLLLENYVNRVYIDLIGREPLDTEMDSDVQFLRDADVTLESRESLIYKLQFDTTYIQGDSSYKFAYFHRMYEMIKVRLLEGASNTYIGQDLNNYYQSYVVDSVNGNMIDANKKLLEYHKLNNVLIAELQYYNGIIEINEMHRRMIYNSVYDQINMNTFNYINAAFDNLLFRYPTPYEFEEVYLMINDNTSQIVLGTSGNNKENFSYIICASREFYEGVIIWAYGTLLARDPSTQEIDFLMQSFYQNHDFQWVQRQIMQTDEYAHF
ncbi:hypothetical protein OAJ65_00560 [Flavobacteriales bacterium]|nr:hypothetical protein [Flavobacteriales bacterium]